MMKPNVLLSMEKNKVENIVEDKGLDKNVGISSTEDMENSVPDFFVWAKQIIQFLDVNSVIFASVKNNKLVRTQLIDVVKFLKNIEFFDSVEAINVLPQPNFVKITFDNANMVDIFKETVDNIDGIPIKFVDESSVPRSCSFTIANLPPKLIMEHVAPQLEKWGGISKVLPQLIPKKDGKSVQVGQSRIKFLFNEDSNVSNLPFYVKVFGFKVQLYIRGRSRICFRCDSTSHLVTACNLKYCGMCRSLKVLGHQCMLSYAAAVNKDVGDGVSPSLTDPLLEQLDDSGKDDLAGEKISEACESMNEVVVDVSGGIPDGQSESVKAFKKEVWVKQMRTWSVSRQQSRREAGSDTSDSVSDVGRWKVNRLSRKQRKRVKKEQGKKSAKIDRGDVVSDKEIQRREEALIGKERPSRSDKYRESVALDSSFRADSQSEHVDTVISGFKQAKWGNENEEKELCVLEEKATKGKVVMEAFSQR